MALTDLVVFCQAQGSMWYLGGLISTTCSYTSLLNKAVMLQLQPLPLICTWKQAHLRMQS